MNKPGAWVEPASADSEAPPEQFLIPASVSLQARRPRTLKHGDSFALFDHSGDAVAAEGSPEGLYYRDTRHLSRLVLTIAGARPILLSSTLSDADATLTCDLTNPDLHDNDGRMMLGHDLIHVRRTRFLWEAGCYERLALRNFDEVPRRMRFAIGFAADFVDVFEVRGMQRERRGTHHEPQLGSDSITLAYTGLDQQRRTTALRFEPAPSRLNAEHALFDVVLEPRETRALYVEIRCDADATALPPHRAFFQAMRAARRALRAASARAAEIASSNSIFNEALRRSVSDLHVLTTQTPEGPYPYAGIPWFSTVFGRDALITALETLWFDPAIARGVLRHLAHHQATAIDAAADAEPGKILHEMRQGEMALLGEVPFRHYYGSIDSTPLFVMLAGAYFERTRDLETVRDLKPHIDAALRWIDEYGDRDGDGFVEYSRRTDEGLINQGWKDSQDSIFHADGALARGAIALAEVQAYVYGAWTAASAILKALGEPERAQQLARRAEAFRQQFDDAFFDDGLGSYVLALDGDKQACRVRSSNAGHALFTGIALEKRAAAVAQTLMSSRSFSGWGVRTIATGEARYNPMSYHNGSVWPHDNAIVAEGLARYGFKQAAARIFEGQFAASIYIDLRRLPELFCGFVRQRARGPTFYPVACTPQAWAAAAPLALLQSCLGLKFDPAANQITFQEPVLPEFLDELVLRRLAVGSGSVDVALQRAHASVAVKILSRRGDVRVVTMK